MALFDSIIGTAGEKFGLGSDKTGGLLAALLGLITTNGFGGFLNRFRDAGLGGTVDSWITTGDNTPISNEQLESALGEDTIDSAADQAGVERTTAASAMAAMIPQVVDQLTPDGEVPDEGTLLSRIGGFLSGWGGAATGAIAGGLGAAASGAFDRGGITTDTLDAGKRKIADNVDRVDAGAVAAGDKVSRTMNTVGDRYDGDADEGSSPLKWLLPLLLLGLLLVLGYWFCGKSPTPTTPVNVNTNKANTVTTNSNSTTKMVDSSFSIKADNGKYTVSGVVPDEATKKQIMDALTAQYGAGSVDFAGLRVDASVKPFAAGWWDNLSKMLPNLKDWKTGELGFAGNAITAATGLPQAALDQLKNLFSGWKLPVSVAGAETATKQANEEALKELGEADSVEEVVKALNVSIISFASGSSAIPADAKPILDKAAEVLKKQPDGAMVEIGGHTDSDGNDDANMKLSQARADSVKMALVALGVKDAMLTAKGYGETAPVAANDTPDNKFKNRRIEYKTGSGGAPTATTTTTTNTNPATANANSTK